jgi:hypothetical protein
MKILTCLIGVVLSLLLLITHSSSASTTYESTAIVGQWVLPDGSAVVQIEPIEGGEYTGIVRSLLRQGAGLCRDFHAGTDHVLAAFGKL